MDTSETRLSVKQGASQAADAVQAVQELKQQLEQPEMSGVVFFCSSKYDLAVLGREIQQAFDCPVIGCTTAGEILSDNGYTDGGIVGTSLSSPELRMQPYLLRDLDKMSMQDAQDLVACMEKGLKLFDKLTPAKMFAVLLIDGMSMLEEKTTAALHGALNDVPLIGGSAGDDLAFKNSWVYSGGEFIANAALITLFETTLPFKVFKTQHFEATDERLVITAADASKRVVYEINGAPAAEEYAAAVGKDPSELTPQVFSTHPVMLMIGGEYYVRSIQKANEDGSLSFYCAIDNGLVLRLGKGAELVSNLRQQLDSLCMEVPAIQLILGCDCILRRLEITHKNLLGEVNDALKGCHFIGFSTYGEQFNSIHVNQTLTGVALGG
ncbi:FIST C-terminal domain-containing protein [bacterium]|nr:FIST C-terminal domain-containing protein [bacterium]